MTSRQFFVTFAFDIDGTCALSDGSWVPGLIDACRAAYSRGANLAFVTGRTAAWSLHFLKKLEVPFYLGALNGAELFKFPEGKFLRSLCLTAEYVEELLKRSHAPAIIYTKSKILYRRLDGDEFFHNHLEKRRATQGENWDAHTKQDVSSVLALRLFLFENEAHELANAIRNEHASVAVMRDAFNSDICIVQVTNEHADKGYAAQFFAGNTPIVAFGDDHNDLFLFQRAERAFAIEGAPKELVSLSDGIIDQNGIAEQMERALNDYRN